MVWSGKPTTGGAFTVTVAMAVPVQVPTLQVAVQVLVEVGETVLGFAVPPSDHVTSPAQFDTVKTALSPLHIDGLLTVGAGFGTTVMVPEPEALHPAGLVHVAVYVVVIEGDAVSVVPLEPVFHDTVPLQPVAVNVPLVPEQIVTELTETVGNGLTVTVVEDDAEQPPL